MSEDFSGLVTAIDDIIRSNLWFDFHILKLERTRGANQLIIAGGIDLIYGHRLEVIFHNVFFLSGYIEGWQSDTKKPVFELAEELNLQHRIQTGYTVFRFRSEDTPDVVVAAESISYNEDSVYYYDRENLQEGERHADFVVKGDRGY